MRSYHISFIVLLLLAATSCNKYLDVQPEDRFLDRQVYSNRASIQNALNGIYLNMAKAPLYGEQLTTTMIDVLAQLYPCPGSTDVYYRLARLNYTEETSREKLQASWNAAYTAILNANLFLYNVQATENVLDASEKELMMGEAYGLRAFIAFDMLRLFGPVYRQNSAALSVPYPVTPGTEIPALLPATDVVDSVLLDLERAKALLAEDPVINEGVKAFANDNTDNFFRMRNRRMNYYAVRALEARVKLYSGEREGALEAAAAVIEAAGKWFPWSPASLSSPGIANPDRIFSSEVIFGLENANMYNMQRDWFYAGRASNRLLPLPSRLNNVYNNFANDYRFRICWEVDRSTSETEKAFFRYADINDKNSPLRYLQPLIRISEMYYIAAECEPDEAKAEAYFNTVLLNRGLPDVAFAGNRNPFIRSEYEKEFWGEGQIFFYYKRMNLASIPSGTSANSSVNMTSAQYVLPLPLSETEFR